MLPVHPSPTRRRGVTLIEVVIAIFILSVGVLGILALFPTGYRLTKKAVDRSIAALASRHALARVYARINNIVPPKLGSETMATVPENQRVGTVQTVNQYSLACRVIGGQDPAALSPVRWTASCFVGYYIVMTSGSADGHIYPITQSTGNTLTTTVRFNQTTETEYEPVRVGDTFALIGIKGGYSPPPTKCFPDYFVGGALPAISDTTKGADPEKNETRTMPVATYGAPNQNKDLWRYSYGCILSAPFPERPDTCRLDVFIYAGFPYRAASANYPDPSAVNSIVIGHYVTYIPAGRDT